MSSVRYTQLSDQVRALLSCSFCKGSIQNHDGAVYRCNDCGLVYPQLEFSNGTEMERVFDFRIPVSSDFEAHSFEHWKHAQDDYEQWVYEEVLKDSYEDYLAEIEGVREIYRDVFKISGSILDVGGYQGRLRYYLSPDQIQSYVSIDPYVGAFRDISKFSNLLKAYPQLRIPCNFVVGRAEELPFRSRTFDHVHMRSCIDHFEDPFKAVREAWRVLKDQGSLVVGVSIIDKIPIPSSSDFQQPSLVIRAIKKIKNEGLRSALQAIRRRLTLSRKEPIEEDHHLFRFDTDNLKRLLRESGFRIAREHWQKPPHDHCLYIEAVKIQSPNRN